MDNAFALIWSSGGSIGARFYNDYSLAADAAVSLKAQRITIVLDGTVIADMEEYK